MVLHKVVNNEDKAKNIVIAKDLGLRQLEAGPQILGSDVNNEPDDPNEVGPFPNASGPIEVLPDCLQKRGFEFSEVEGGEEGQDHGGEAVSQQHVDAVCKAQEKKAAWDA